jgi:hypothetical protein
MQLQLGCATACNGMGWLGVIIELRLKPGNGKQEAKKRLTKCDSARNKCSG